jgi:hypothetical protein
MSVPGSTAISARWASPSTARYLVGFETGPLQFPTQPRPRKYEIHKTVKQAGQRPSPVASPARPRPRPRGYITPRSPRPSPEAPPTRNPNPSFLSRRALAQSLLSAATATAVSPLVHLLHLRSPLSASPSPLRRLRGRVLLVPLSRTLALAR